jgi:hypothetical protein
MWQIADCETKYSITVHDRYGHSVTVGYDSHSEPIELPSGLVDESSQPLKFRGRYMELLRWCHLNGLQAGGNTYRNQEQEQEMRIHTKEIKEIIDTLKKEKERWEQLAYENPESMAKKYYFSGVIEGLSKAISTVKRYKNK